jgi:hypothetical protein
MLATCHARLESGALCVSRRPLSVFRELLDLDRLAR